MIRYGVAGVPPAFLRSTYRRNRVDLLRWLADIGLRACELQMTYGPRTRPEVCLQYRDLARDTGISISIHASYFIVFTSADQIKIDQSSDTLKRTFELADILEAKTIVLHPGSTYGLDGAAVLPRCMDNVGAFMDNLGKTDIGLFLETAGKIGQLGSVNEVLELASALEGVHPCIDFGHVHARTLGSLESREGVNTLVDQLEDYLNRNDRKRIHFHYTPIHYGARGEIQHRAIHDKYPTVNDLDLFGERLIGETSRDGYFHPRADAVGVALTRLSRDFTVISETYNSQEEGALALKDAATLAISKSG
ncbi:TIM barrel protein [Methylorubrum extorquens]|uniref:TIM barrel protein n=1 Tax=Methylorubrum extorquens TaxID=408 RepID=UPI003F61B2C8